MISIHKKTARSAEMLKLVIIGTTFDTWEKSGDDGWTHSDGDWKDRARITARVEGTDLLFLTRVADSEKTLAERVGTYAHYQGRFMAALMRAHHDHFEEISATSKPTDDEPTFELGTKV